MPDMDLETATLVYGDRESPTLMDMNRMSVGARRVLASRETAQCCCSTAICMGCTGMVVLGGVNDPVSVSFWTWWCLDWCKHLSECGMGVRRSFQEPLIPVPAPPDLGDCVICLEKMEEGSKVIKLDCGHHFCPACIDKWVKVKAICPSCRKAVEKAVEVDR